MPSRRSPPTPAGGQSWAPPRSPRRPRSSTSSGIDTTLATYERLLGAPGRPGAQASGVGPATDREIAAAAALYAGEIAGGFLSSLGEGVPRRLYRRAERSPGSWVLVARDGAGQVEGCLAGTEDTAGLYRELLRRDGLAAAIAGASRLVRRSRPVLEILAYRRSGQRAVGSMARAGLLAMAVRSGSRGRGWGGRGWRRSRTSCAAGGWGPLGWWSGTATRRPVDSTSRPGFVPSGG